MAKARKVETHQFRTELIRELANIAPGCVVVFVEGVSPGIGFQLQDQHGRLRSNIVKINRATTRTLQKSHLMDAIRRAGNPTGGLPPGF